MGHRLPSILLAGPLLAMEAPGGGEIQMLSLARALAEAQVPARIWRPWEDTLSGAGCVHLFGSRPEYLEIVAAARRAKVRVALSTIAWYGLEACWHERRSPARRLASCARFLARAACPAIPSWRRRLYESVDLLMPNSQAEAEQLMRYFGVPARKIHVVPNGAEGRFAEGDPRPFVERFGLCDFVLYAGRIEPRKNQLGFLRAMRGAGAAVVILGDAVPGHERYLAECCREAGGDVTFIDRLEHDDPLLAGAYAACGCLALASWYETPGLVALEAGMSGTPLVLPRAGCAAEYFGPLASYVDPRDAAGIRRAVLGALARGRSPKLAEHVRENFSWHAAAEITREAYAKIL
jgi:glycosyltransferase involved in cell wall biosynthesis